MGYHTPIIDKPKIQILRGFAGNSADNLSRVVRAAPGEQIRSGQVVRLNAADGLAYVADSADHTATSQYFIAYSDYTDGDAKEAGLQLIDIHGVYELMSAWFDTDGVYTEGTPLTVGTVATAGLLTPLEAPATAPVIGVAVNAVNGSCVRDMTGQISETQDMRMLRFQTRA